MSPEIQPILGSTLYSNFPLGAGRAHQWHKLKFLSHRENSVQEPNCFSLITKNNQISSWSGSNMNFPPNAEGTEGKVFSIP